MLNTFIPYCLNDLINKLVKYLLVLFLAIQSNGLLYAQLNSNQKIDTLDSNKPISWVGQYPSPNQSVTRKNIFSLIGQIVLGRNRYEKLSKPISVMGINPNDFWVLDQGHGTLFHIIDGESKTFPFLFRKAPELSSLVGLGHLSESKLLFTDSKLEGLFVFIPKSKKVYNLNDTLELKRPTGVAFSESTQEIWIVETMAHRITVLDKDGHLIKTIGNRGDKEGEFNFPTYIWIDNKGDVYVVDTMNFRVQLFNKNGEFVSMFGEAGDTPGFFASPKGIATDSKGNIYVVDILFHSVQVFDKSGRFLYNFGKKGWPIGHFWMPSGIYIDKNDYIYVADSYNYRIQIFKNN